jgi:hypothetical protein
MPDDGQNERISPQPRSSSQRTQRPQKPQRIQTRSTRVGLAIAGRDIFGARDVSEALARPDSGALAGKPRLFAASFLMLFVELALIRWIGANIIYLAYYSNFVLLGSFLGIGAGFLRARSRVNLFPLAPVALALLVYFVLKFPVQVTNQSGSQLLFFGSGSVKTTGLPTWQTLPVVFLAVAAVMAMIGEGVARAFVQFRPLDAYRLDILGSIAGIVAFSALSFTGAKPLVWALVVALVLLVLYGRRIGILQAVAVACLVILLGVQSLSSADIWSPYYRISVISHGRGLYTIDANGVPHQNIQRIGDRAPIYFAPYRQGPSNPLTNVLVIGAGNGNDVAVALKEGAKHVDAVEIDPQIYRLGRRLHPDHPYQDPRVSVYINDGRAFLQQTRTKYDMILFALPDSLTLVSGQSALRLESYLFTQQAVEAARAHLDPGTGVLALYNYYRTAWLRDRLANTLRVVFGHAPCASTKGQAPWQLSMLTVGTAPAALHCGGNVWRRPRTVVPPATDDRPFVYLKGGSIPGFYLVTLALILAASVLLVRAVSGPYRRTAGYLDLFFMGAAFMLLETKNVVQFALLFGTTWFVNALVFTGVLLAVLAAVEVSRHTAVRRPDLLYLMLLAALAVAWAVPARALLDLPLAARFAAAVVIAFTPIFLANMVFSQRFRDVGDSGVAFGANLLGAMVGGAAEYASLVLGYRALLIMVAALYGLAFLTGRARLGPAEPLAGGQPRKRWALTART